MDPLATGSSLDLAPGHVAAIAAVAAVVVLVAVGLRQFLVAYGDQLADLWREYGPVAVNRLLARRRMPATPWYCDRCRSYNLRATTCCYACGARRAEAEAPVPEADPPAGPSAGREQRTRRP